MSTEPHTALDDAAQAAALFQELRLEDLDLGDLGMGDDTVIEEISDDEAAALEGAVMRAELYEAQESTAELTDEALAAEASVEADAQKSVSAAKPKRAKAAKGTGTPRTTGKVEDLPPACFVLGDDVDVSDLDKVKAEVLARRPGQKKIAEKFDNLLLAIAANKAPSTYVTKCFEVLKARGTTTSAELVAALGTEYSIGTARSQAGQVMVLFDVLGIATRTGQTLAWNPKSTIARILAEPTPSV